MEHIAQELVVAVVLVAVEMAAEHQLETLEEMVLQTLAVAVEEDTEELEHHDLVARGVLVL